MTEELDEERQKFEGELNEWIAKQGLWTQLRLGWARGGAVSLVARVILVSFLMAVLLAGVGFFALNKYMDGGFRKRVRKALVQSFEPGKITLQGGVFREGNYSIKRLILEDNEKSLFSQGEVRNLSIPMQLGDGLWSPWRANTIKAEYLELRVPGRFESEEALAAGLEDLLKKSDRFSFNSLDVRKLIVRWEGGTEAGLAIFDDARFSRDVNGWAFEARSGNFDFLWLDEVPLGTSRMLLTRKGIEIQECQLAGVEGALSIGGRVAFQQEPEFDLKLNLAGLELQPFISDSLKDYLKGRVSGSGSIRGKVDGELVTRLDIQLMDRAADAISLSGEIPVLDALSYLDPAGSYARMPFTSGSLKLKLTNAQCDLSEIKLSSSDGVQLRGAFSSRPPTPDEIDEYLTRLESSSAASPWFVTSRSSGELEELKDEEKTQQEREFSGLVEKMKKEAMAARANIQDGSLGFEQTLEMRRRRLIEGDVRIGLPQAVIARQPEAELISKPEDQHHWIDVKLDSEVGNLADKLAEEIRRLAR